MTCPHCHQRVKEIKHALYWEFICGCRVDVDIDKGKLHERFYCGKVPHHHANHRPAD